MNIEKSWLRIDITIVAIINLFLIKSNCISHKYDR